MTIARRLFQLSAGAKPVIIFISFLGHALAVEPDLLSYQSRHPGVQVENLVVDGPIEVFESSMGREYIFDASARVRANPSGLMASALDYSRYPEMGMPHLEATYIVDRSSDSRILWVWNQMSYAGFQTSYYLEVERLGDRAIAWRRVPKISGWNYPERVILDRLSGSFYLEELPDGSVYIRYVMVVRANKWLPAVLVDQFIRTQSATGIKKVIQSLVRDQGTVFLFSNRFALPVIAVTKD